MLLTDNETYIILIFHIILAHIHVMIKCVFVLVLYLCPTDLGFLFKTQLGKAFTADSDGYINSTVTGIK